MTTRTDHLTWCKERALEYLPGDPANALASMLSDLRKHEETESHAGIGIAMLLMFRGELETTEKVRDFINGFG